MNLTCDQQIIPSSTKKLHCSPPLSNSKQECFFDKTRSAEYGTLEKLSVEEIFAEFIFAI